MRPAGAQVLRCSVCSYVSPAENAPTNPHDSAPLPIPLSTVLRDRYRLVGLLGRGAHGVTYQAHHEFLNLPCVVKVLPHAAASASEEAVQRLRREAAAGFRVSHPGVVRVLDCDLVDGVWYFVMEYASGIDLAAALQASERLDWRQAVDFAVQAAEGLAAIHAAGLVHCDVKPGNLILGTDGRLRLADLGVARFVAAGGPVADNGLPDGSLAYAAPEVLEGTTDITPSADLYALGAVLFELITGRLPRGNSVYRTLLASDDVSWPQDIASDAPDWLRAAILRLLASSPAERFESADALLAFLDNPSQPTATHGRRSSGQSLPEPRGIAVMPLDSTGPGGGDDWIGQAVADHLARGLARLGGAYVVDASQFQATLARVSGRGNLSHERVLREAGRLSGAASVIEGQFTRQDDRISLAARVHQVGQDRPLNAEPVAGPLSALAELEGRLLHSLATLLRVPGLETPGNPVPTPAATRPEALERFFGGKRAFLRGDYDEAMRLGQEAVTLDPDFGEAVGFLGVCCARMGRYDEAVAHNRQQQALAARVGDDRLIVEAHANLGSMHYFKGEYEAANDCLQRAADTADRLGLTAELALIRNNLGFVLLQLGRQGEAERTYRQAIDTHKQHGALVALIGPYNGLGHVLREQKRYEEARDYFRRALRLAQESDDRVNEGVAYMNLGYCALAQGRVADAKHELLVALNILEHTSFWNGLARVYEYMAELNMRISNWAEAARCAEQRIELAQRHANAPMEAAARQQRAEALQLAEASAASPASEVSLTHPPEPGAKEAGYGPAIRSRPDGERV